jgi:hypothetical protein
MGGVTQREAVGDEGRWRRRDKGRRWAIREDGGVTKGEAVGEREDGGVTKADNIPNSKSIDRSGEGFLRKN